MLNFTKINPNGADGNIGPYPTFTGGILMKHTVLFHPDGVSVSVETGTSVLEAMIAAGLAPDAPCGGKGTCGKCRVSIQGQEVLAC